jgi:hypothetical protein
MLKYGVGKVRVDAFSISIDGFGAGPDQTLENPLGVGGMRLHEWIFGTDAFQKTVLLGSGENLLAGMDLPAMGFERREHVATPNALHVVVSR